MHIVKGWNDFWHSMAAGPGGANGEYDPTREMEFQIQIGSKMFPEYPMQSTAEVFYQLTKTLGVHTSSFHGLDITRQRWHNGRFIVGIDTEKWMTSGEEKTIDVLVYDKIRWDYDCYNETLLQPIISYLEKNKLSYNIIRYGSYNQEDFLKKLKITKSMIFLCEHETQGLAYQQVLACDIPIFAWERGGYWQDPYYYPERVKYKPVSSVPYWDDRCGSKFKDYEEFEIVFKSFFERVKSHSFSSRDYILENLTLEKCASKYLKIVNSLS